MFEISLYALLGVYALFVLVFIVMAIVNIYHLVAYGFFCFESIAMILFLLFAGLLILGVSAFYIIQIDWAQTFTL